jgi:dolichol-phosphate mannosyltransferase
MEQNTALPDFNRYKIDLPTIAVVIPAYRAARYISTVLSGIPEFVSFIVVVDDCSSDNTAEVVKQSDDTRVEILRNEKKLGVGGTVLTGYAKALELGAEIIVKMDSDGQMDPKYLLHLIIPILTGKADYTKGNRFLHKRQLTKMPIKRLIGNTGLSFLTKMASGYWNVFDPTNGYTAIHSAIIPLLDQNEISRRYFFESSMLIELGVVRAVVRDVNIPAVYQDESSSLSEIRSLFGFPPRLFKGFMRRLLTQYFIQDFGMFSLFLIVGLSFILFGFVFGVYHWYLSIYTSVVASTGTIMLAVLPIILGTQLLIQSVTVDIQNVPTEPLHAHLRMVNVLKDIYR